MSTQQSSARTAGERMRGGGVIGRLAARLRTEERGLTLIELVVSMSLFAVLMSGAIIGLSGSFNLTRGDRSRSVGANLASQEMDVVRAEAIQDFKAIKIGTTTATHSVDGVPYTVKRKTKWVTKDATSGACDGISGAKLSLVSVRVTVTWPNMGATSPVTNQTVLTPPVGVYDPETGNIGVKVFDATATGESGVIVHVSGPAGNLSDSTDSEGCAFFGFLAPGAYTVYLNSPGKVDDQGVQNPSQPASVVVGSITSIQFDY